MSVLLPLRADSTPHFSFEVALEGITYKFEFRWNVRGEFWVFDIADGSGEVIVAGQRVVVNLPLLDRYPYEELPSGSLFAYDSTNTDTDPTLDDFGTRVTMVYLTAEEMAE